MNLDGKIPSIDTVVELLGLERSPKYRAGDMTYMVKCPFCSDPQERKFHMKIDVRQGVYHCYTCGNGQKGTGTLDLYGRVRLGKPHIKGPGGNGGELLSALLRDLGVSENGQGRNAAMRRSARPVPPPVPEAMVASDRALDRAYSFILNFPVFCLSARHRANLIKRGLDDEAIQRNGYATMPSNLSWTRSPTYAMYGAIYDREKLDEEKRKHQRTRDLPKERLVAGLIIAAEAQKQGITLKGIPGMFMLGRRWCCTYNAGMLIPTRNRKGQVVALQTRTDGGGVRYLTLSASGLPYGVSRDISRTHFPLENAKSPKEAKEVLCTEGPLKADIVAHLYDAPVFVMAVHGVSNTKELGGIFRGLLVEGVTRIGNAFDMDKLCNVNVRDGSRSLNQLARSAGLVMYQKCWDAACAQRKWNELADLCRKAHLTVDLRSKSIYVQIARMADALHEAKIPFCRAKGGKEKDYWSDETKGLDDFLLYRRRKKEEGIEVA